MTELPNPAIGGVGGADDLATNAGIAAVVLATGTTLAVASLPSPAMAIVESIVMMLDVANLRSPMPFYEAGTKWGELAKALRDFATQTEANVSEHTGKWSGPSADAFRGYVNQKLLPPVRQLADGADQISQSCQQTGQNMVLMGFIPYIASFAVSLVSLIAASALKGVPYVGAAMEIAIKTVIDIAWGVQQGIALTLLFVSIVQEAMGLLPMIQQFQEITHLFDSEGARLDSGSQTLAGKQLAPVWEGE